MNKLLKTAFILGIIIFITAAKPARIKVSFAGSWKLDITKSDFGDLPKERAAPLLINLIQENGSVTFDRKFQNIPSIPKEILSLDGKEIEIKQDEFTVIRTLIFSENDRALIVTSQYHMTPEGQMPWDYTRLETYALAKDGKSMLLTRISTLPDGKQEIVKAHYDKTTRQ